MASLVKLQDPATVGPTSVCEQPGRAEEWVPLVRGGRPLRPTTHQFPSWASSWTLMEPKCWLMTYG